MAQTYFYPPQSATVSIPAIGVNGTPIPASSILIAGENPSLNLQPLQTDALGNLKVDLASSSGAPFNVNVVASVLPTGAATEATLLLINGKLNSLGQKAMAASMPVAIASDQSAIPITAASLPLPAGAATSALQTSGNASLSSIDGKMNSLGQKAMAASMPVAIASDQSAIPISAASLPLPTGAATEATLSSLNGKVTVVDTSNVTVTSSALPTGAATEATLSALSAKFNSLGQKTMANSAPVVIASDQSSIPVSQGGRTPVTFVRNDYSSTNVTTAAYVQLIASTPAQASIMEIFDSSGQTLKIAFGAAASEVDQFLVFPGGNGPVQIAVPVSTRVSIRAVSANATVGEIDLNLYS